jgi:hypothetical protein
MSYRSATSSPATHLHDSPHITRYHCQCSVCQPSRWLQICSSLFPCLAFVIKKLVELQSSETIIIFEGTPSELLERLNQIAIDEKINTTDRVWPKDRK